MASGLFPAISTSRAAMTARIQDARPVRTRTRRWLVGVQLALSTALLVVAALLVRTVSVVSTPGSRGEERVLSATFGFALAHYDRARVDDFERLLPRDIVRLIVGESATVALIGAVVGALVAVAVAMGLRSLFVGVGPTDPASFAGAAGVLIATVVGASAHPALRASRTSVLRTE